MLPRSLRVEAPSRPITSVPEDTWMQKWVGASLLHSTGDGVG